MPPGRDNVYGDFVRDMHCVAAGALFVRVLFFCIGSHLALDVKRPDGTVVTFVELEHDV